MERKKAFNILWKYLVNNLLGKVNGDTMKCQVKDVYIELERNGKYYEYQVYIAVDGRGFTTVDIRVILEETEDYEWCWNVLKYLGFYKDKLGIWE
jgi:hypothetical protein